MSGHDRRLGGAIYWFGRDKADNGFDISGSVAVGLTSLVLAVEVVEKL